MKISCTYAKILVLLSISGALLACRPGQREDTSSAAGKQDPVVLADSLEESLFRYILEPWYPLVIDTLHGGYLSEFRRDWSPGSGTGNKALVQQARHVWATARVYEAYPAKKEYLDYAGHGFLFLRDVLWDREYGGFHAYCTPGGQALEESLDDKRIYGQAFGVYGLSQYYRVSNNPEALDLVRKTFLWMETHAHDPVHGGYFEFLHRDGSPVLPEESPDPTAGLKDYNSSIHLMEALAELYLVWPDSLVRERLEEMYYLIRDTFVHPDGYLRLYFQPDWTHVTGMEAKNAQGQADWFFEHFTYGHDVETAYLLLETAHVLGWGDDAKTRQIARKLVDHSLASGWDTEYGGFFDAGVAEDQNIRIVNKHKSWWGLVEGMNALLLMHTLYPGDSVDYYALFLQSWNQIDTYLIDKTYGGWYNSSLDTHPESIGQNKSHIWKTTYHNARGMLNCIQMLRSLSEDQSSNTH
jgi:mannobiose 2-epimerase